MNLQEIWKEIDGTSGAYLVSNLGRVKSLNYRGQRGVEKVMTGANDEKGYRVVTISMFKGKKTQKVHRLVAKAFLQNPNGYTEINHIDGNKENNCVSNLEWTDRKGNMGCAKKQGALDNARRRLKEWNDAAWKIPVVATSKETGEETSFDSIANAATALRLNSSKISACLNGRRKSTGGYTFRKAVSE